MLEILKYIEAAKHFIHAAPALKIIIEWMCGAVKIETFEQLNDEKNNIGFRLNLINSNSKHKIIYKIDIFGSLYFHHINGLIGAKYQNTYNVKLSGNIDSKVFKGQISNDKNTDWQLNCQGFLDHCVDTIGKNEIFSYKFTMPISYILLSKNCDELTLLFTKNEKILVNGRQLALAFNRNCQPTTFNYFVIYFTDRTSVTKIIDSNFLKYIISLNHAED